MTVRVQSQDFDVGAELARLRGANPRVGAIASFVGLARDLNDSMPAYAEPQQLAVESRRARIGATVPLPRGNAS